MRKSLILLLLAFVMSCNKTEISLCPDNAGTCAALSRFSTKVENESYFLGDSEIKELILLRTLEDKTKTLDFVIPIYIDENELPVAYVIQYDDGWEVAAADKRVCPTICESNHGLFTDQNENANFQECLYLSELDICEWRLCDDEALLKDEKVQENLDFWDKILNPENTIDGYDKPVTKVHHDPILRLTDIRLVSVLCDTVAYDTIPHLITTHWHQGYPYNQYVPLESATSADRCPAGCVAVSAGQMMYFLHCLLGSPSTAPTTATVSGYAPNSYAMSQGNYSAQAWTNIASGNSNSIAILLANIGTLDNMDYAANGSGAAHSTLPSLVFAPYGISCVYHSPCSPSDAFDSLEDGVPVIAAGYRLSQNENGEVDSIGHSFIIDRYERSLLNYTDRYEEYYIDTGEATGVYYDRPRYNSPIRITKYGMNWGWGNNTDYDSALYYVGGSWYPAQDRHYDFDRDMIYDFGLLN